MTAPRLIDWQALKRNLSAGARLALFRRTRAEDFATGVGQIFTLLAALFLWSLTFDYLTTEPVRTFSQWGFANYCINYLAFVLSLFLIARLQNDYARVTFLLVTQLAATCTLVAFFSLLMLAYDSAILAPYLQQAYWAMTLVYFAWSLAIFLRSLRLTFDPPAQRAALYSFLFVFINWTAYGWFPDTDLWYADDPEALDDVNRRVNIEDTYYAQDALLRRATDSLLPNDPDRTDLYFMGLAGYASQDVFMKEVNFARDLFDTRFATRDRSMLLVNNRATIDDLPLANLHNLQTGLRRIAEQMDTDQDMLFLFMTSHGSSDHKLAVDFYPLDMNDISAPALRAALDASGIKWRIILVSACYSGGFINALKDDHTLIMTAAATDRQSFGCGSDRDFTYFGETYLRDQLPKTPSFIEAFYAARATIQSREQAERLSPPSNPQIFIGAQMEDKLARFEAENRQRYAQWHDRRTSDDTSPASFPMGSDSVGNTRGTAEFAADTASHR